MSIKFNLLTIIFGGLFLQGIGSTPIAPECGNVLAGSSGRIEYKLFNEYSNNQRCIWTIRAPGMTDISFKVLQRGTYWSNDFIWVTAFGTEDGGFRAEIENRRLVTPGDNVTVHGSVVVLTFAADSVGPANGFIVEYTMSDIISNTSSVSVDVLSTSPQNKLSHPISGTYSSNETSTFVLANPNFLQNNMSTLAVTYDQKNLAGYDCSDSVAAYKFNREYGLGAETRFCSQHRGIHNLEHDDFMVFVFRSDYYLVESGFGLSWAWM